MKHTVSEYYYLDWVMFALTIVAFIVAIHHKKEHKELWPIYYYIIISLFQDLATIYFYFFLVNKFLADLLTSLSTALFSLSEFGFFMAFIIGNLKKGPKKIASKIIFALFYFTFPVLSFLKLTSRKFNSVFFSLEAICLILAALFYFHELLSEPKAKTLIEEPTFWVILAILFYFSCSLPIYLFRSYLIAVPKYEYKIFAINFLLYSLIQILFIKAYLCSPKAILK